MDPGRWMDMFRRIAKAVAYEVKRARRAALRADTPLERELDKKGDEEERKKVNARLRMKELIDEFVDLSDDDLDELHDTVEHERFRRRVQRLKRGDFSKAMELPDEPIFKK